MQAHRSRRAVVGKPVLVAPVVEESTVHQVSPNRRALRRLLHHHEACLSPSVSAVAPDKASSEQRLDSPGRRRLFLAAGLIDVLRPDRLGDRFSAHYGQTELDDRDGVPLLNEAWRSARHFVIASLDHAVEAGLTTKSLLAPQSQHNEREGLSALPLNQIRDLCVNAKDHLSLLDGLAHAHWNRGTTESRQVNPYGSAHELLRIVRSVDAMLATSARPTVEGRRPNLQPVLSASIALVADPLGAPVPEPCGYPGVDSVIAGITRARTQQQKARVLGPFLRPWARHRIRGMAAHLLSEVDGTQQQNAQATALDRAHIESSVRTGHRSGTAFSGAPMACIERMTDLLETGIKRRPEYDIGQSQDSDSQAIINLRFGAVATAMDVVSSGEKRLGKEESLAYRRIVTKAIAAIPIGDHHSTARLLDLARTALTRMTIAETARGTDPMDAARLAAERLRGVTNETTFHLASTRHPERMVTGVFVRFTSLGATDSIGQAFSRTPADPQVFNRRLDPNADARIWVTPLEDVFHLDHDPRLLAENLGFGTARITHGAVAIIDIRNPHTLDSQTQDVTELVHASRAAVAALASGNTDMARMARTLNYDREGFNLLCQKAISEENDRPYAQWLGNNGGSPWAPGIMDIAKQSDPLIFARLAIHRSIGANEYFRGGVTQDHTRGLVGCPEFLLTRANRLGAEVGIMECSPLVTPRSPVMAQLLLDADKKH